MATAGSPNRATGLTPGLCTVHVSPMGRAQHCTGRCIGTSERPVNEAGLNTGWTPCEGTGLGRTNPGIDSHWEGPNSVLKCVDKAAAYFSVCQNAVPHGPGTFTTKEGAIYAGTWVNGQLEGRRYFKLPNGAEFYGDLNGKGTYSVPRPDGSTHVLMGTFHQGIPWDVIVKKVGGYILGRIEEGRFISMKNLKLVRHGAWVYYYSDEKYVGRYRGSMDDYDLGHGQGEFISSDGNHYIGPFVHGRWEGASGVLKQNNGMTYRGAFKNNVPHGQGTLSGQGYVFEGHWVNGSRQGQQYICKPDGMTFFGDRDGAGTLKIILNGRTHVITGTFKAGKPWDALDKVDGRLIRQFQQGTLVLRHS